MPDGAEGRSAAKAVLRARMRGLRDALAADERRRQEAAACRRLLALPEVRRARAVAVYRALGSELALDTLVEALAAQGGVRLAAPVALPGRRMEFVEVTPDELLAGGPEGPGFLRCPWRTLDRPPSGHAVLPPEGLDVAVVPGLAFDRNLVRLGYGGGYYDAWLARAEDAGAAPFACGVCFRCQLADAPLPREEHDRRLDAVVVPEAVLRA